MKNRNLWIHGWVLLCAAFWLVCALWLCGCLYVNGGEPEEEYGKIAFLDVGQGLGVLLEYGGRYALYDVGPDSANFIDTLRNRGVDSLDWVLLSHNHRDHYGGLLELWADSAGGSSQKSPAVHIARLVVGPDTAGGFLVDSVLRAARRRRIPVDTVSRGDVLFLGAGSGASSGGSNSAGGIRLDCLWPPAYIPVGENGASVVMRLSMAGGSRETSPEDAGDEGGGTVLLTGDLDSLGEMRLLEMGTDVSAELLQVGHHGSARSSTLRFLSRVSPRYAVVSVGAKNSYGHPAESVLRKLQYVLGADADSAAALRTDVCGSVSFLMVPGVGIIPQSRCVPGSGSGP